MPLEEVADMLFGAPEDDADFEIQAPILCSSESANETIYR